MDLDRLPPAVLIVVALSAGLAFQLLLGTSYVAAFLDPVAESDGVPVAVVNEDRGAHGQTFAATLSRAEGPVRFELVESRAEAVRSMEAKERFGAIVILSNFTTALESFATQTPHGALVELMTNPGASTSGSIVAQRAMDAAIDGLRAKVRHDAIESARLPTLGQGALTLDQAEFVAEPVYVQRATINAVPERGANGLAPTYLAMAAWIGGYIGAVALQRYEARTKLAIWRRSILVGAAALVQSGIAVSALLLIGLNVADPLGLFLVLAAGTWMAYALVALLLDVFGLPGVVPAFAIMSLGLPASGAVYPVEMLPDFFRGLHAYDPFTWLIEGLRTTLYAPGASDLPANVRSLAMVAAVATAVTLGLAMWREQRPLRRAAP